MQGPDADAAPFHTIVVGAGSGGLTVAFGLARAGKRVALVERGPVGGDCTNVGCIPSKTLIDLAKALGGVPRGDEGARRAFAVRAQEVLREVRSRRDALLAHEEHLLAGQGGLELVRGSARLVPRGDEVPDVVVESPEAGERTLRAPHVVLAPGSEAIVIDVPGLPPERILTNATLFELASPPERLAILGAGAIGCEMAFAFADLGSAVTLIDLAPRVLPRGEEGASPVVHRSLEAAGVRVLPLTSAVRFDEASETLHVERSGEPIALDGVTRVLMAIGRRPTVRGLGLEEVGVETRHGAIVTDAGHRTGVAGVSAIGDATGRADTTHAANAQGRRVVRRILAPLPLVPEGAYPSVTFSRPEVAQIGPTLEALRTRYPSELLVTHRVDLADTDRGLTLGLDDGFVSITAMRFTGRVLAATVVAPTAGEMIHLLTLAQRSRMSLWRLSRMVVAYPALSEAIRGVADAFVFSSLPRLHREAATYLRLRWRPPAPA
jgi:dihydrolipoamide dehydrogenase